VEKTLVIHSKGLVYYYYQFVYKLVYYNYKTVNANPESGASIPHTWKSRIGSLHVANLASSTAIAFPHRLQNGFSADSCQLC
jgi:hypothetical protein